MYRGLICFLFCFPVALRADNFSPLAGLWDVHVKVVQPLPEDLAAAGLTPRMLQTDAELRLRLAGLQAPVSRLAASVVRCRFSLTASGFRMECMPTPSRWP